MEQQKGRLRLSWHTPGIGEHPVGTSITDFPMVGKVIAPLLSNTQNQYSFIIKVLIRQISLIQTVCSDLWVEFLSGVHSDTSWIIIFHILSGKTSTVLNQLPKPPSFSMKTHAFEYLCLFSRQPKCFGYILLDQLGVLVLCENIPLFHVFQTVSNWNGN